MCALEEILNPGDEVVLECTLDDLVEKVGGEEFIYVGAWKVCREGLVQL